MYSLINNLIRSLPDHLTLNLDLAKIKPKKIFKWIKSNNVSDKEMLKTFNCGVGFCLIVKPRNLKKISRFFSKEFKPYIIGEIDNGKSKVKLNARINWN